jgi:hypothetical protein
MPITSTRSRYEESEKLQNSTEPIDIILILLRIPLKNLL